MPFRAVLFDLDGTLLDTLDDLADSANSALGQLGFPEHPTEAYKYFIGDGIENLVRRALPEGNCDAATFDRYLGLVREQYTARWADKTRPFDGVGELLDALAARDVPMAVLSNKPDEFTRLCVERLLAGHRFEIVLGASPSLPKKPDPAGARHIAERLQLKPEEIVYLGDTATDMQTAVRAAMYPVGALWGFRTGEELSAHGARVLIEKPGELLRLLEGGPAQ
ncbi:MAG: HAD family hydrolase [Planctomycetota bacterium]